MTDWLPALTLETHVAEIIHQQELNGVEFDLPKAYQHVETLTTRMDSLFQEVRPHLVYEVSKSGESVMKPFIASGDYAARVYSWYEDPSIVGGPFSKVVFEEPSLGSRKKLIKQLLRHGWKPTIFTDGGKKGLPQPKLTVKGEPVDSLFQIEAPVGKQIAKWYTYSHRRSQINGWIKTVRPDGRLTAGANSCGTNTYRMRHRGVTNVPKADPEVIFGYEMRDLFIARKGYKLLGYDAAGLEARCMAHYTYKFDGGEFADLVLNGDIHAKNARIFFEEQVQDLDVDSPEFKSYRSRGKNGTYCLMYGGQPRKLASTISVSQRDAKYLFNKFWKENEALGKLRSIVMKMHDQRGWIPGVDGRRVWTRSSHSALNALFQSCGAIIMKKALVILTNQANKQGIHHYKVIDMHDEGQHEVRRDECSLENDHLKHPLGELAIQSIKDAGQELNLNCELDGDYSIGNSWAETH